MNKIAIYGGAFNPVTYSHIEIIKTVMPYVDEVWVMPVENGKHPWRKNLINVNIRNEMIIMALRDIDLYNTNKVKLQVGNNCPTIKLMRKLRKDDNCIKFILQEDGGGG